MTNYVTADGRVKLMLTVMSQEVGLRFDRTARLKRGRGYTPPSHSGGRHHLGTRPRGCGYRADPGLERPREEDEVLDGRPFLDRLKVSTE